jgi:hypothetical protein
MAGQNEESPKEAWVDECQLDDSPKIAGQNEESPKEAWADECQLDDSPDDNRISAWTLIKTFTEETSLHGPFHITANNRHPLER